MQCLKVFKLIKVLMKKAVESHELPGCAANAALAAGAVDTGGSWVFPAAVLLTELALQSDTCVGLLGWNAMEGTCRVGMGFYQICIL